MSANIANEANEPPAPTPFRGIAAKWLPLAEAAGYLGVSAELLRLFARGVDGRVVLESREKAGRLCVQPGAAYAHLLKHARCKTLTAPPGWAEAPASDEPVVAIDPEADLVTTLQELVHELRRQTAASMGPETLRAITGAISTLEKITRDREKRAQLFTLDQVLKRLRTVGEIWCDKTVNDLAPAAADRVLKFCREVLGSDLSALNVEARMFIIAEIQASAKATVEAVQKAVEDGAAGLQDLPLGDPEK